MAPESRARTYCLRDICPNPTAVNFFEKKQLSIWGLKKKKQPFGQYIFSCILFMRPKVTPLVCVGSGSLSYETSEIQPEWNQILSRNLDFVQRKTKFFATTTLRSLKFREQKTQRAKSVAIWRRAQQGPVDSTPLKASKHRLHKFRKGRTETFSGKLPSEKRGLDAKSAIFDRRLRWWYHHLTTFTSVIEKQTPKIRVLKHHTLFNYFFLIQRLFIEKVATGKLLEGSVKWMEYNFKMLQPFVTKKNFPDKVLVDGNNHSFKWSCIHALVFISIGIAYLETGTTMYWNSKYIFLVKVTD